MDDTRQFETMAVLRAYAQEITEQPPKDMRPSTARLAYYKNIARMVELAKLLDQNS